MTRILVIDDDQLWCEALKLTLTKKGFKVELAHDGISGLQKAYATNPDVILLDIMMPGMDGKEVCTRFREMADIPVIMLTALNSPEQMIEGLDLGADDYIHKTVTPEELVARIKAVLRRTPDSHLSSGRDAIFQHEHLFVDFHKREVIVNGERIDLSPTEYKLLSVLIRYRGRVLPHDFLLTEVWGPDHIGETRALRLYIGYLRRKLEKDPENPSMIFSEWGIGYRFG
jgi:two-component system KDP operon response regulator KdpE